jgi:hypothetical protein
MIRDFLARLDGESSDTPMYLADLTLWYRWHKERGSLPEEWQGYSLPQIARLLGTPLWWPVSAWRAETPGVEVVTIEQGGERSIRYETASGTLIEHWSLGPDGDWWQTGYPLRSGRDLPAARELVQARSYVVDTTEWDRWQAMVGDEGILALALPKTPYSDLLHTLLGWSEGLMLLMGDERDPILDLLEVMETKYQALVGELACLPGAVAYAPDNLDGQFIPPAAFRHHMAESYRQTAATMHAGDKRLIVHVGGMCRHLLAPLAAAGVDGVEGVAGPPQSDAPLARAREMAGAGVLLWGGIPQDFVLGTCPEAGFRVAVREAADYARTDGRVMLGVADRVPVDAQLDRLRAIAEIARLI